MKINETIQHNFVSVIEHLKLFWGYLKCKCSRKTQIRVLSAILTKNIHNFVGNVTQRRAKIHSLASEIYGKTRTSSV